MSNRITVKLRLVKDFEIKVNKREAGTSFSCAVSRGVDNKRRLIGKDGKQEWVDVREPNWFSLVIFPNKKHLLEVAGAELRKGANIVISGELQYEIFKKNDKEYRCNKIIVSDYSFQPGSLLQAMNVDSLPKTPEKDPSLDPDTFADAINSIS